MLKIIWGLARPFLLQLGLFGAGAGLSWWLTSTQADNKVLDLQNAHLEQRLLDAEASSAAFAAAWARGDALAATLAATNRAAWAREQELNREIESATTGGVCLREPALRVLDRAAAPAPSDGVSGAVGKPDGADAGRVATDADALGWALNARARYAECVRRYHALIDYYETPDVPRN